MSCWDQAEARKAPFSPGDRIRILQSHPGVSRGKTGTVTSFNRGYSLNVNVEIDFDSGIWSFRDSDLELLKKNPQSRWVRCEGSTIGRYALEIDGWGDVGAAYDDGYWFVRGKERGGSGRSGSASDVSSAKRHCMAALHQIGWEFEPPVSPIEARSHPAPHEGTMKRPSPEVREAVALYRLAVDLSTAVCDVSSMEAALATCDWIEQAISESPSRDEKNALAGVRNVIFNFLNERPAPVRPYEPERVGGKPISFAFDPLFGRNAGPSEPEEE